MAASFSTTLTTTWNDVAALRRRISAHLSSMANELKSAIIMTASELAENAIKHGVHGDEEERPTVVMTIEEGARVILEVSNAVSGDEAAARLIARVAHIRNTDDKESLYISRVTELLADPSARGGIGLYRIAFEGEFDLHVRYIPHMRVVTVSAMRGL
jgi:hypothetical protein